MTVTAVETTALQDEVRALARERDAVILAHNYQVPEVQDVADYVGDSLGLSRAGGRDRRRRRSSSAASTSWPRPPRSSAPEKTVLIPDLDAGCSLAASITADQLRAWKARAPGRGRRLVREHDRRGEGRDATTAARRATRKAVIEAIPADQEILFLPGHVPRPLAREGHRPQAARSGSASATSTPASARPTSSAGRRGARRRAARPPRVRLREPVHGVRATSRTHILSTEGMVKLRQASRRRSASSSRPRPGSSTASSKEAPGQALRGRVRAGRSAAT